MVTMHVDLSQLPLTNDLKLARGAYINTHAVHLVTVFKGDLYEFAHDTLALVR